MVELTRARFALPAVGVVDVVGGASRAVRCRVAGRGWRARVAAVAVGGSGIDVARELASLRREGPGDGLADRFEEGSERGVEVLVRDAEVPVEEEEELFLHEVDLLELEEARGVGAPVLVLGGGVVEVLGAEDEGGEEDPVTGAGHTLGHGGQLVLQPVEIDHGRHERRRLHARLLTEDRDEGLEGREADGLEAGPHGRDWWSRRHGRLLLAADDRVGLCGECRDHLRGDLELDELCECLLRRHIVKGKDGKGAKEWCSRRVASRSETLKSVKDRVGRGSQ